MSILAIKARMEEGRFRPELAMSGAEIGEDDGDVTGDARADGWDQRVSGRGREREREGERELGRCWAARAQGKDGGETGRGWAGWLGWPFHFFCSFLLFYFLISEIQIAFEI